METLPEVAISRLNCKLQALEQQNAALQAEKLALADELKTAREVGAFLGSMPGLG